MTPVVMGKELDQVKFFAKSAGLLAALGTALRAKALLVLYVLAYVLARRRKTAIAKELDQFTFFAEEGWFSRAKGKALAGAFWGFIRVHVLDREPNSRSAHGRAHGPQ